MSHRQYLKNVYFLATSDTTNSSVASIVITGGLSVQKNVMLSQNLSVGNITTTGITVGNLNLTGTLFNNGTLNTSSQWNGTTGNLIYFGSTGSTYVGINTSTPTFNLDVSGGARISTGITTASLNASVGITSSELLVTGLISSSNFVSTTATIPNLINTNIQTAKHYNGLEYLELETLSNLLRDKVDYLIISGFDSRDVFTEFVSLIVFIRFFLRVVFFILCVSLNIPLQIHKNWLLYPAAIIFLNQIPLDKKWLILLVIYLLLIPL